MRPTELIPSREMTDDIGLGCRLAYGIMLRTRAQLVAMHGTLDHGHVDQMMGHLAETEEWLKATAKMVEMAYVRVLASAAAAHTKGVRFEGVDYESGRRKAVKKKSKRAAADTERSKIIEQCVIYVQCLAAYDAGFSVDHTGDADYAGKGRQISKARRAMAKLIGLSPHCRAGAEPLTALELHAKAGVLAAMYGLRNQEQPDQIEQTYIRFFAGEVSDFLAANRTEPI